MPPAYEVLLLNTAIPQIQAAQTGDTYVVPRDIAFSTVANLANGTNLLPSLTFSSDTNTGIYREGADALGFTAGGGTNQMVLTSTGLGVGTNNPAQKLDVTGAGRFNSSGEALTVGASTLAANTAQYFRNTSGYSVLALASASDQYLTGVVAGDFVIGSNAKSLRFGNAGTGALGATLDSSGNLGLGVTPSAKLEIYSTNNAFNALQVRYNGSNDAMGFGIGNSNGFPYLGYNTKSQAFVDAPVYERSNPAAQLRMDNGSFKFNIAPSGTANTTTITNNVSYTIITSGNQTDFGAANNNVGTVFTANASGTLSSGTVSQNISFTQAMTLDASGNLLVGGTSNAVGARAILENASGNQIGLRYTSVATYYNSVDSSGNLLWTKDGSERARITSGGYFKASDNGTYQNSAAAYHELRQSASDWIAYVVNSNAAPFGINIGHITDANSTGSPFLACNAGAALGTLRAEIRSNGGLANYQSNNVDLSDIRTKTDINPLASYWSKIAALEIVSYRYKDQTHDDLNIGVIAQQVEQVAPEFVDADGFGETPEDGVPLKTIYNKDLTFAAIKALQEAMARIEKLEAEVAALKGA